MYNARLIVDPLQARMDSMHARLRSLDLRIARKCELRAGTTDPLAIRLIKHSPVGGAGVLAKLPARCR